jgi:hypothetical protein
VRADRRRGSFEDATKAEEHEQIAQMIERGRQQKTK